MTEHEQRVKKDSQIVARRMNELIENKKEMMNCLMQYQGPPMVTSGFILNPGDIMVQDGNKVISSRGIQFQLNKKEMADLISDGVFDYALKSVDINSSDFGERVDDILSQMHLESNYQDADMYMCDEASEECYALYLDKKNPNMVVSAVQRIGAAYYTRKAVNASLDMFDDLDESDYLAFNPNGANVADEIQKTALSMSHATVEAGANIAKTAIETYTDVQFGSNVVDELKDMTKVAVASVSDTVKTAAEDTLDAKEAGYDDINPGMKAVKQEIEETVNPERQNTMSKFQMMKEQYDANGRNNVPTIEDITENIMKDNNMSAKDKLEAMKELQDKTNQEVEQNTEDDVLSPLATSKAMRFMQ